MTDEQKWFTRPLWIASAAFLAVIAVTGVALAVTGGDASGGAAAPPVRHARPVDTGGSACGLARGSQDPVVGPPAHTTWTLVGDVAAPSIPGVGPGIVEARDRRCFAHSALGAVDAAANLLALTGLVGRGSPSAADEQRALQHFLPGRVRDIYAAQPAPPADPNLRMQIAGFRSEIVDENNVTVTLAIRGSVNSGAMLGWVMPMVWYRAVGDWVLRLGSADSPFIGSQISSLDGFIPWSGA